MYCSKTYPAKLCAPYLLCRGHRLLSIPFQQQESALYTICRWLPAYGSAGVHVLIGLGEAPNVISAGCAEMIMPGFR